jgi:hypothetical protein
MSANLKLSDRKSLPDLKRIEAITEKHFNRYCDGAGTTAYDAILAAVTEATEDQETTISDLEREVDKLTDDEKLIHALLEKPFWISTLETMKGYSRLHDDHDGTYRGSIYVQFGRDGDAHILSDSEAGLRFRMPEIGGGMSPRVRNALMILAEAIRLDNQERPIEKPVRPEREKDERQALTERVKELEALLDGANSICNRIAGIVGQTDADRDLVEAVESAMTKLNRL